jgi:hypothetical protein
MPVFGKSLFETVLDGLADPQDEEEDDSPAPVRGLHASFVGREWSAGQEIDSGPSMFDEFLPDPAPDAPILPVVPGWIDRTSEAEIAEDLGLSACRNEHDLRERRRLFALANHPDRVLPEFRQQATRRMMIANQMVDAALKKLR